MKISAYRLIALLLTICLVINQPIMEAFASSFDAITNESDIFIESESDEEDFFDSYAGYDYSAVIEETDEEPFVIGEDTSVRGEYVKGFVMSDITTVLAAYSQPIHFIGEDGEWEEINNELIPIRDTESGEIIEYRTKANSFETTFQKEGDQNNLLELTEGDNKINFSLITAPEDYILEMSGDMTIQVDTVEATVTLLAETESAVSLNDDDITGFELNLSETEVLYEDVLPGVSLQYITLSNGVKENIILNQRADSYNYTFSLSLVGLKARLVDNTIELYDQNDPAKIEYIFPAPFMYDNNGEQSTLVSYNLTVINEAADLIDSIAPDMEILLSDMESEETAEPNEPSEIVEEPTENLMEETENEGNIESETAGHEEELIQTELLEFLLLTSLSENIDENSDIDETDTEDDTEELPDNNLEPSELEDDFETISPDESIPDENVMEQLVEDLDDAIAEKLKTENYYIFTINADENWINADERAFPVVVDPILQKLRANEADTAFGEVSYYCQHGNAECTHYSWETNIQTWGHVGRVRSDPSPSYVIFYVDLFYNFLSTPNIQISSAIFRIQTSCNIAKRLELYSESLIDFGTTTPNDPDAKKSLTFDITRLFMTGDTYAYFEIHAQNPNENNFVNITPQFGSSPYLTITYRDFTGLEPYISTHSQSVGRAGTGYITDYNGNLTYIHNDVSTVGNRMTADLKHVYNSTPNPIIKNLDPFTKAGNNWQLNYQQTLTTPVGEADINTYPHVWTDGDGTKHYFKKATVTYWVNGADRAVSGAADEDGLGLFVVPVEDAALKLIYPFKIVDRSGSTSMYFDKAGRLCLITDANQRENAANASTKDRNRIEIVYSNTGLSNATMDNGNFKYFSDTVQWLLDNLNIGYTTAEWRDYGLEIHQYITKDLFQTIIFFENREIDPFIRVDKSLNTEFNAFRTQIKALCDAPNSSIATRKTALTTAMTRIKNVQKKIDELDPILCRRIVKIIDAANKEIIIEYGSNGLISSISDPTIEIKAPVTTNKLHYKYNSSGDLTSITYPYPAPGMNSGNCESLYTYIDGRLASAKNETGYSISYSYHNNSYRDLGKVSRVDEYAGSVKGQSVSINYRYGESTTYRFSGKDNILGNADDVFNTYNFDFDGKTLSIRSESAGKLLGGSMYSYTPNGGQNANKLTESAQGSAHTINLLKNHSFERGTNGLEHWTSYSTCTTAANHTMDTVTTRPFIGKRTLRLQSRSGHNGRIGFRQTVTNLKPNVDYTYSGYIKTESFQGDAYLTLKPAAGAQIILSNESGNAIITNTDGSIQTLSVSENSSDIISRAVTGSASALNAGWVRVNITFRVSKETSIEVGVETAHTTAANKTTTAFFDALQLEEGLIANPYNIIEDASFEQFAIGTAKPGYWTFNNGGTAGSADIINGGIDGKQSFEIKGEFNKGKTLRQDLQLSNQASYVLSGWFKLSDVAPITGNRLLRVEVVRPAYDTVVANSTLQTFRTSIQDEWVYFCMALPKLANWDGAYLQFRHSNNVGKLEIDNIQLLRQDAVFSSYDTAGKLINRTAAATEEKTTRTRDLVRTHTNTSGNVATHTYDANTNDLTLTTYTVGPEERYTYDRYGNNLTKQTGAAALRYFDERTYSADGRFMLSESNIVGNMNKYNYNETNGLLERSINPNSITTDYSYNSRGQQTAVSHNIMGNFVGFLNTHATSSMIVPILPPTTFSYNSLNLLNSIGHNNFNYNFTYDAFGNRTSIKVENDTLTEYTYQAGNGVLLNQRHNNNNLTEWEYDTHGRPTIEKRNGIIASEVHYDNAGNIVQKFDYLNKRVYTYEYDAVGRERCQYVWDNSKANAVKLYEYEKLYDTAGRLAEIWYVTYTNGIANPVNKYQYTFHRDDTPNISTLPNNTTLTYTYDALRRLTKATYRPHATAAATMQLNTEFTYLASTTAQTGTTTPLVATYTNKLGTVQRDKYTYGYNSLGNISYITDQNNKNISYSYDNLSRLRNENNEILNKRWEYYYDNGGNISTVYEYDPSVFFSFPPPIKNYTYDTLWKDKLINYNGTTITYDKIGNPLNWPGNKSTLTWENGRQLKSLIANGKNVSYTYTLEGIRLSKSIGSTKTEYTHSGSLILQQKTDDEIMSFYYDDSGKVISIGYKANASAVEVNYFVTRNAQGDIVSIYNSSNSTLVGSYSYDAWGNHHDIASGKIAPSTYPTGTTTADYVGITLASATSDPNGIMAKNPFRYRGYYYDNETKFYYLNSRYYDPEVGRFINADDADILLALEQGSPDQYNLFAYCLNNPVNMEDPSGYIAIEAALLLFGGCIIAATVYMIWVNTYDHTKNSITVIPPPPEPEVFDLTEAMTTLSFTWDVVVFTAKEIKDVAHELLSSIRGVEYFDGGLSQVKNKDNIDPNARPEQKKRGRELKEDKKKSSDWVDNPNKKRVDRGHSPSKRGHRKFN